MKSIIHVNMHTIRTNARYGKNDPPLTVKTYKSNTRANNIAILDKDGEEVARVVYSPEKPLSCGARVWITCDSKNVRIIDDEGAEQEIVVS